MIPVVSWTAGIRIKDFGLEIKLTHENLMKTIKQAISLSEDEMAKRSFKCAEDTVSNHSIEKFGKVLENSLKEILMTSEVR